MGSFGLVNGDLYPPFESIADIRERQRNQARENLNEAERSVFPFEGVKLPDSFGKPVIWKSTHPVSRQGWQCPVCGRVMAPTMPNCTVDHSQDKDVPKENEQVSE